MWWHPFIFLTFFATLSIFASEIDIAVIGAGVNGTYLGWKLASIPNQEGKSLKVEIFEASPRVGGRLYSVFFPGMKHIPAELGGMRFKETHQRVKNLINSLGLSITSFSAGDANNIYYLRGVHLRKNELTDPMKLPYKLSENEKGKTPSEIIMSAILVLVPNFQSLSENDWKWSRERISYQGKLLKDISWINFLSSHLNPEAFQFLVDTGYLSLISDTSALSQLNVWKTSGTKIFFRVREGYQAIPLKLAEKFQEQGGYIHLNHRLVRISQADKSELPRGYELTFENDRGEESKYIAQKIILTISPTALQKLLPETPLAENAALQKNLRGVSGNNLTVVYLAYPKAWWRELDLKEGLSETSMPLNRCYYYPSEEDFPEGSGNKNALLLASYQGAFTSYWRSLNASKPFRNLDKSISSALIPGENLVIQIQHQLKLLHGIKNIPEPYAAIFQDWGQAPYYGGIYTWNVGIDPQEVQQAISKPSDDEEIYIFTSDFSENPSWVESALSNSDLLLNKYFGFPLN